MGMPRFPPLATNKNNPFSEGLTLAVDTRKVKGRRTVRYDSFEDVVADAEQLAAIDVESLGNWSLGQTLAHLGAAMEGSISGKPFMVPMWLRVLGRIYLRRRLVYGPFPPGFQLPAAAAARLCAPRGDAGRRA